MNVWGILTKATQMESLREAYSILGNYYFIC